MSKKPLAGKRWFEALGRRASSRGEAMFLGQERQLWPLWARHAYTDGWLFQEISKAAQAQKEK